jgi:hypothetical protein
MTVCLQGLRQELLAARLLVHQVGWLRFFHLSRKNVAPIVSMICISTIVSSDTELSRRCSGESTRLIQQAKKSAVITPRQANAGRVKANWRDGWPFLYTRQNQVVLQS